MRLERHSCIRYIKDLPVVLAVLTVAVTIGSMSGILLAQNAATGSARPAFEAATVRLDTSPGFPMWRLLPGGRYVATRVPFRNLVRQAYGGATIVRVTEQIVGGPDWIDSDRFTIQATAGAEFTFESPGQSRQAMAMLGTMLEDRFKLKVRVEKRELPAYALTLVRQDRSLGPSLKQAVLDCRTSEPDAAPNPSCALSGQARTGFVWPGRPISHLVAFLNINVGAVDRLVIDRTNLAGAYDMRLQFIPPFALGGAPSPDADTGTTLQTALQEQLGLKLEPIRAPVDVIVIEHVERPTPN